MPSVVPKFISMSRSDKLMPWRLSACCITSRVPEPNSLITIGIDFNSASEMLSFVSWVLSERTIATSSSSMKDVYFSCGWRITPSTIPISILSDESAYSISLLLPLSMEMRTSGNWRWKAAIISGTTYCEMVVLAPIRSSPVVYCCRAFMS